MISKITLSRGRQTRVVLESETPTKDSCTPLKQILTFLLCLFGITQKLPKRKMHALVVVCLGRMETDAGLWSQAILVEPLLAVTGASPFIFHRSQWAF